MLKSRRVLPAVGFLTVLGACGAALAATATPALTPWQQPNASSPSPLTTALAVGWVLTAVAWVWLAAGALLAALRRAIPALRHHAALDRVAPAWCRTLLDRALVAGATVVLALPAVAPAATAAGVPVRQLAAAPPYVRGASAEVPPVVRGAHHARHDGETDHPEPVAAPQPPTRPSTHTGDGTEPPAESSTGRTHTVRPGDNLWTIARAELLRRGAPADNAAIARYWGHVLRVNRGHLRSGNPDLIFPGEVVALPAY